MELIKGKGLESIPATLVSRHSRNDYEWDKLQVGDHFEFTKEEDFAKIRSSSTNFARGTKDRPVRAHGTQVVERATEDGKKIKVLEVWRLADPEPVSAAAVTAPVNGKSNGKSATN